MTASELRAAFLAKLQSSGLSQEDARKLGYRTYSHDQAKQKFPNLPTDKLRAGFVLPYYDLAGRRNGFYRYRLLDVTPRGFQAMTVDAAKKTLRYIQEPGSSATIYLSHNLPHGLTWEKIAADSQESLSITEGELKAACACKHGVPTIGLPGASYFQCKREGLWLLKGFEQFQWEGRELHIIFDSDCANNPQVRDARQVLCGRLVELGARVFLVNLPPGPENMKMGLDDFLLWREGGKERLLKLMKAALESPKSVELWRMNEIAVYSRDCSGIYVPSENRLLTPTKFIYNYKTHHYTVTSGEGKSSRTMRKIVPTEWLEWSHRRESRVLTFDPTEPPLAINAQDQFNMFQGLPVAPHKGDGVQPWQELMSWMFPAHEEEYKRWFLSWAAYPLQNIEAAASPKMHSCVALISVMQGSGKGMVGETLGGLYGQQHYAKIGEKELTADYNEWSKNLLFVLGNEITADKRYYDDLKALITETTFWLNQKYLDRILLPNHQNFLFTSNHYDAFFLSFTDRRFFVYGAPEVSMLDERDGWGDKKVNAYVAWRDSQGGRAALLYYLLRWKIPSDWDHRRPPESPAKFDMQVSAANQAERWLREVKLNPAMLGGKQDRMLWSSADLLAEFQCFAPKTTYSSGGMGEAARNAGWIKVNHNRAVRWLGTEKNQPHMLWGQPRFAEEIRQLDTERALANRYNAERAEEWASAKSIAQVKTRADLRAQVQTLAKALADAQTRLADAEVAKKKENTGLP